MNEHDHGSHHSHNLDPTPDDFYEALIAAHRDLAPTDSHVLDVRPGEVALIRRGLAFKVALPDGPSRR